MKRPTQIKTPQGKLAVLLPGLGAVATTTIAGVCLARRGLGRPFGSVTQLGTIRLGKRTDSRKPPVADFLPLAKLADLEFGAWDIFPESAYEAAQHAKVLDKEHLDAVREELEAIRPMRGVFYPEYVKRLSGTHVKSGPSKASMVEMVRDDIRRFVRDHGCSRAVAVWCGSTEIHSVPLAVHRTIDVLHKSVLN